MDVPALACPSSISRFTKTELPQVDLEHIAWVSCGTDKS